MTRSGMFGSKSGVTLVELLVVMLIVVILAVTLTPLFRDYVERAKYVAEAVPLVGDLRTRVTLFQYEHGYFPGPEIDAATGRPTASPGSSGVQTFDVDANRVSDEGDLAHFARRININYDNISGKNLKPNHVFYRVSNAGYKSGGHMFVVGVMGDGNGLRAMCGYAVIEIDNPTAQRKIVATWERWRPETSDTGQLRFADTNEGALADKDIIYIGDTTALVTGDVVTVNGALEELRAAGWEW